MALTSAIGAVLSGGHSVAASIAMLVVGAGAELTTAYRKRQAGVPVYLIEGSNLSFRRKMVDVQN